MSLLLATLFGVAAARHAKKKNASTMDEFVSGIDALGAQSEEPAPPTVVSVSTGNYWNSVAAGLTVAGIVVVAGYVYNKARGRKHDFDGLLGG